MKADILRNRRNNLKDSVIGWASELGTKSRKACPAFLLVQLEKQ
jgi:hypothetical protein